MTMTITEKTNTIDEVYVSIYDNPIKKQKGRPKGPWIRPTGSEINTLTADEKVQKNRDNAKLWYDQNTDYVLLKKKIIREMCRRTDL